MGESKKHHIIPQCYLSNFSNDGKGIWVYNKKEGKAYLTSVDKIFQKKNWYRIPDELIPEQDKGKINPLSIEEEFFADQVESQFNHYLKSLVCNIDELLQNESSYQNYNCRLHEDYVDEFSMQIAIQFFRTPKARKEVMSIISDIAEKFQMTDSKYMDNDIIAELNKPHTQNPTIAHFWTIFANDKFIPSITEILKRKIWLTCVSPNVPFYTSDSPVIVENLNNMPNDTDISLNRIGGIITYPITSKVLFKLLDREYYADMADEDRSIFLVNDEYVKKENMRMFSLAQNEIVSPVNNFDVCLHYGEKN
jgi:hypothetical protein